MPNKKFEIEVGYDVNKNVVVVFNGFVEEKPFMTKIVLAPPQAVELIDSIKEAMILSNPAEA